VPTNTDSVDSSSKDGRTVTVTTYDMLKKKKDIKARTTLLLSLPDKHQLRFIKYKTARELWDAILKTFSGNEATKKKKKNLLKQQYGNFKAEGTETLEQTFNRLQNSNNEDGNTVCVTTATITFPTGSVNVATISQDTATKEKSSKALMAIDGIGWDWSYMENEEDLALVVDGETPIEFALMANNENKVFDNSLCSKDCKKNTDSLNSKINELKMNYLNPTPIETLKEEKDVVDGKLARLLKSSKDLENIIESQRSEKVKEGVGYNVVPPPAAELYLSPKKDLSWTGLPEFVDDTVTEYSRPSPTVASTLAEDQNKDTSTYEDVASTNLPKPFVKFVKPKDSQP
nr:ribonuclease H-like domain-containing protein [Tanacetum cinerariifolium]